MELKDKILNILKDRAVDKSEEKGQLCVVVSLEHIISTIKDLSSDKDVLFNFLVDICGVDTLREQNRFQVVYHMLSQENNYRLRIKVDVPDDTLTVPSVTEIFKGADWMEREAYDMYGIRFEGHPDHRRILMHEDFLDYPQRRDFPLRGHREESDW